MKNIQLLDTIAILDSVSINRLTLIEPEYTEINSLPSGQVGTVVEMYEGDEESKYLVEFADNEGREYAMAILTENELLVLHYELQVA